MLATAEATHEFVLGPRASFILEAPPSTPTSRSQAFLFSDTNETPELEVQSEIFEEPSEQARRVLDEIVRRSEIDVARYPDSTLLRANLGLSLFRANRLDEAEEQLRRAITDKRSSLLANVTLASVLWARGSLHEARNVLTTVLARHPDNTEALRVLADVAIGQGRFDEASELWKRIDELDPGALPPYQIGVLDLVAKRSNEAIRHFKLSVRRDPRSARSHHALGVAYAIAGQMPKALNAFRIAARLDPDMPEALHGIATALRGLNRDDEALAILARGVENHSHQYRLHELLSLIYVERKYFREALSQLYLALRDLQELGGDHQIDIARVANNLGVCYVQTKGWSEAKQAFRRAMDAFPTGRTIPANNLGLVAITNAEYESAREVLVALRDDRLADEDTLLLLAESYSRQGEYVDAVEVLDACINEGLASWKTYATQGVFLSDNLKEFERAIAVLREGYAHFPAVALVRNNLAYAYLMAADPEDAREILDATDAPDSPLDATLLIATRGLLSLWEGDMDRGREFYDKASRMASDLGKHWFARQVRQKKHLELARALLREGRQGDAVEEVKAGLSVVGRPTYRSDLEALAKQLDPAFQPPQVVSPSS
jgi:tetratricopeptide (TPR) repeat protein